MKCPFRTVTVEKTLNQEDGKVVSVEFAECIYNECPYYGKEFIKPSSSGGFDRVIKPICRRADND